MHTHSSPSLPQTSRENIGASTLASLCNQFAGKSESHWHTNLWQIQWSWKPCRCWLQMSREGNRRQPSIHQWKSSFGGPICVSECWPVELEQNHVWGKRQFRQVFYHPPCSDIFSTIQWISKHWKCPMAMQLYVVTQGLGSTEKYPPKTQTPWHFCVHM